MKNGRTLRENWALNFSAEMLKDGEKMGFNIPKQSFVVGYENPDGTLSLYAFTNDPERFDKYETALKFAEKFGPNYYVYKMKFEEVEK